MNTTVTIENEQVLKEAQMLGKHSTAEEAVIEALKQYIRYQKQRQILDLFGTIEYDENFDYKQQRDRT